MNQLVRLTNSDWFVFKILDACVLIFRQSQNVEFAKCECSVVTAILEITQDTLCVVDE